MPASALGPAGLRFGLDYICQLLFCGLGPTGLRDLERAWKESVTKARSEAAAEGREHLSKARGGGSRDWERSSVVA